MFSLIKNNGTSEQRNIGTSSSGIAVPLVLGALTILSALVTDFAYNSTISLRLANNARDRLQAEYLSYSSINFMRLELKIEQSAKSLFAQLPAGTQGAGTGPLCKQFPLSTELLKAIFVPGEGGGGEAGGEDSEVKGQAEKARMVTVFDTEAAKEFLGFSGDFSGECADEGSKLNLNVFAGLDPAQQTLGGPNTYDRFKEMFVSFLSQKRFKELFDENADVQIKNAVRNIADWVDQNEQVNEKGGAQAGAESASYTGDAGNYKIKNGKMATLDEVFQIAGVADDWFAPLKDYFTVYGGQKINLCNSEPEVVEAVVTAYAVGNPKYPAFNPANKKTMNEITAAVSTDCGTAQPSAQKVAQSVEAILGATPGAATSTPPPTTPTPPPPGGSTAAPGSSLADLIDVKPRFYKLVGTGQVRDVAVRATAVLDVKEGDPKKWKVIYWHID